MLSPVSLQQSLAQINDDLKSIKLEANNLKLEQTELFLKLLVDYNEHTNLVADATAETLVRRHLLDSLTLLQFRNSIAYSASDNKEVSMIDLGSGAGFPGLCLAIWQDQIKATLVDSNNKKTRFLNQVVSELGLNNRVEVVTARLEELGHSKDHRGKYDLVTARALGHLLLNCELGLPLLKLGGSAIFYKTLSQAKAEHKEIRPMLESLGGRPVEILNPTLQTGQQEHVLVHVIKQSRGSDSFPRKWQTIKRQLNQLKEDK